MYQGTPQGVFVGRGRELAELEEGLQSALRGHGRVFLVCGDAGIGKTYLAEALATQAVDQGAAVVWARSWEDPGPPPYWPWLQVVRSCLRESGGVPTDLLDHFLPELSDDARRTEGKVRFLLFDAISTFLRSQARKQPLVLLFDDLQWADLPSLRLLDSFARVVGDEPMLVLGMYREIEGGLVPELANELATIARHGPTLPLRGLSEAELGTLVHSSHGLEPPPEVLSALWSLTEGNPFFADEIVRLFLAETRSGSGGADFVVPQSVREVIRRRLEPLDDRTRDLLRLASVIGREFDLPVLERAAGATAEDVLSALAQTDRYGVLRQTGLRRYEFSHALIRDALYEESSPEVRAGIHLRVAEAVEELHGDDVDEHLVELAHHLYCARELAETTKVLDYLTRAGRRAEARSAYGQAAEHYDRALEVMQLDPDRHQAEVTDLLLTLGQVRRRAGAVTVSMEVFRRAAEKARAAGLPERFARAVTGFEDSRFRAGDYAAIPESLLLLQEALDGLAATDERSRAEVLSRRPQVLQFVGAPAEVLIPEAEEAMEIAERSGDAHLVVQALQGLRWAHWDAFHIEECLEISERFVRAAHEAGDPEAALMGNLVRFVDFLTLGRMGDLDAQLVVCEAGAKAVGQPWFDWWPPALRSTRALLRGALDEAEQEARVVETSWHARQDAAAGGVSAFLLAGRAWDAGQADEMERAMEVVMSIIPVAQFRSTARAHVAVVAERYEEAQQAFDEVARRDFSDLPKGIMWLPLVGVLSSICGALGDIERARLLSALLADVPPQVVIIAPIAGFLSTPHWLGVLAATEGRGAEAEQHFEEALRLHANLGAWAWLARTRYEYGRMLLARGQEGDLERGLLLLRAARELATSLGMRTVADRASEALEGSLATVDRPAETATRNVFRREGDVWCLIYGGKSTQVRHGKGLDYLHLLLQHPGEELHVLRLLALVDASGGEVGSSAADAREAGLATGRSEHIEALDAEALQAYRRRLDELREEIEQAEAMGDPVRTDRAQQEADWIGREMSRALGLGGRDRGLSSSVERARVNVRRTIQRSLDRIAEVHPELGEHLHTFVRTGTFCAYLTDPAHAARWEV